MPIEYIDKEKGGPRGTVCSLAAVLGMYDAYNGLVQPSEAANREERNDENMLGGLML